jgi:MFS family permease
MTRTKNTMAKVGALKSTAMRFVLLIGVLSFFADFTYEGSRSVLGPYLESLGATATIVGLVAGFGELLGYGLRLVSGRLADVTGRFWTMTIFGYVLQMASVPALALTTSWEQAAVLIMLERVGKAIRNPPRDVMLSHAAKDLGGYGWTFGIHEALDQFGAMFGPLAMAAMLAAYHNYHQAFAVLVIPAFINILFVLLTRTLYPQPQNLESHLHTNNTADEFAQVYWVYLAAACLIAAGFADYSLIAYHFAHAHSVGVGWIPLFYAVAMAVSGGSSLLFGRLFDRFGFSTLIILTLIGTLFAPLVFFGGFWAALLGAAIWGMGMGVHESIIPAAVTPMVSVQKRASAFGLFTAAYGISWFVGSAVIGMLYDRSLALTVGFCVVLQLAAVLLLACIKHKYAV